MQLKNIFIHHVFFWLHDHSNAEHRAQLIQGLQKLSSVTTIRQFHIGVPANTNRNVIENTYDVSWFVIFDNLDDEESYQSDPIHLNFVAERSHLWKTVRVHDSVDPS